MVNCLPHFVHFTIVSFAFNRSNFFEPQTGQMGQDLIFSIVSHRATGSLFSNSTHSKNLPRNRVYQIE